MQGRLKLDNISMRAHALHRSGGSTLLPRTHTPPPRTHTPLLLRRRSSSSCAPPQRAAGDGAPAQTAVEASTGAPAAPRPNGNGNGNGAAAKEGTEAAAVAAASQQSMRITATVVSSIDQVPQSEWDALANADGEANPFVSWTFLHILEASGSAAPETGWAPQHVLLRDDATGCLVGAAPCYLKMHSAGEYVFDQR
jgi:hypothetical protein